MNEDGNLGKGRHYASFRMEYMDPRLKQVFRTFSGHQFNLLLDIGCGNGSLSVRLKEMVKAEEVYGIEISPQGTEIACKAGVNAFCLDIDREDFPFSDNFFNAVFCGEIIEHLFNPDHLLEEIKRTLKPGGLLVLSTPNLAWWLNRLVILLGYYPFGLNPSLIHPVGHIKELSLSDGHTPVFYDHVRLFTLSALSKLLKKHGFHLEEVTGIGGQIPQNMPFSKVINLADRVLSLRPSLSFRFVVNCTKEKLDG